MMRILALAVGAMQELRPLNVSDIDLNALWQYSLTVGAIARHITRERGGAKGTQETAMLAVTMHDLGKLVLAKYAETQYHTLLRAAVERQAQVGDIEHELMDIDHALISSYLAE